MAAVPKNPVQLVIEADWVVESIISLGSGYQFHLTYGIGQVQPETLADLRNGQIEKGHPLEIIHASHGHLERVAEAELEDFMDYQNFIRIDFRILQVPPSLRDGIAENGRKYFCHYMNK